MQDIQTLRIGRLPTLHLFLELQPRLRVGPEQLQEPQCPSWLNRGQDRLIRLPRPYIRTIWVGIHFGKQAPGIILTDQGGMSTNLYAGGVFELEADEALIIENRIKQQPHYIGFQLANLWGESLEYANRSGSLNGSQTQVDADGVIRLVVAHRDPGVPNWLDTSGHREGFLTPRWAYSERPDEEQWPSITAKKVRFDEIRAHLPESTSAVSDAQRRAQIAIRQRHVQRRFRQF